MTTEGTPSLTEVAEGSIMATRLSSRDRYKMVLMALRVGQFNCDLDVHARTHSDELAHALSAFRRAVTNQKDLLYEDFQDIALVLSALTACEFVTQEANEQLMLNEAVDRFERFALDEGFYIEPEPIKYKCGN